ncbi:MAG: SUMF1/EgtB/PvdO family nonheme iron enzyme [Paramuribaculum sp.]|nr:SUMF1/EgtB/PvdO family nonheme iron enzyme [Paramuribaculum sp.]
MKKFYFAAAVAVCAMASAFMSCSDDNESEPVSQSIEVASTQKGGTITVSTANAAPGDVVTITAVPDDDYKFGSWDVKSNGTAVKVADPTALTTTFVMPAGTVTVSAKFLAPGEEYGLTMVKIPAGTRMLGSKPDEPSYYRDEKLHQVTLTKDFYMSAYEVTNQQFADFLNAVGIGEDGEGPVGDDTESYVYDSTTRDQGKFNFGVNWDGSKWVPAAGYEDHPIIYVSWYGADAYAKWVGGALPTEAQWEYACRGGQEDNLPFGIGDGTKMVKGMAQFYIYDYYDLAEGGRKVDSSIEGYVSSTYKVGSFEPNGYGLYDMHGNAYEWVNDFYKDAVPAEEMVDPTGPETGNQKMVRGGGWSNSGRELRTAVRWGYRPTTRMEHIGFRVVL